MKVTPEQLLLAARPVLEAGRAVSFCASGGSMEPFIHNGESVTVCRADTYRPGDVVLATIDGGLVLHYIASACGDRFTLMGAANLQKTETCRRPDILARLISPRIPRPRLLLWHRLLPLRRLILYFLHHLKHGK